MLTGVVLISGGLYSGILLYFVQDHSDAPQKYSDEIFVKILDYLIDNIFVAFSGWIFQQTIGIPMGTNCVPLLIDLFYLFV